MGPKKGLKTKKEDDDDLDAFLDAAAGAGKAALDEKKAEEEAAAAAAAAAALAADDDGDDDDEGGGASAASKKKKKKKAKGKAEPKEAPKSAMAQQIQARQAALKEEEQRLRASREAEEKAAAEEEAAAAAERKKAEEQREAKRKKQADKVAAQKASGTYMTKAEKEKAKKQAARLETMRAAGMLKDKSEIVGEGGDGGKKVSQTEMYASKKKPSTVKPPTPPPAVEKAPEPEPVAAAAAADDDSDDDWETAGDDLAALVSTAIINGDDDEDLIAADARKEKEKLRILGIERAKREEIARAREKEAEALRCEMEREEAEAELKKQESRQRRKKRDVAAYAARSMDNLRSPISVIMGHVDTGKTKLLDKIRNTNVQEGEAGGITQQIGATQFPQHTLQEKVEGVGIKVEIPGLLMIDTPGHESFTNLRNRGSTLCDIAILVIDLMHGLEQQTIESLNMLRNKKAPFVIALNKVDRCYGWKSEENSPIRKSLARQDANTLAEFKDRKEQVMLQLSQQGINTALYWDNDSPEDTISLVPTSAMTGEGVPDILGQLITYSQTTIREKLQYVESMQCTVLEVKVIEGLGTTVDVVLVNGTLKEGDTIIVSTMEGPVVTQVRALLTPPPNREMRIKADYQHHSSIHGSIGVKIVAPDIGRAVAGTPIMVVHEGDEASDVMEDVQSDLAGLMKGLSTDAKGVMVHASTLGALEALLQFLREECKPPIPVSHISIGTIFKKDVMRAGLMHDKNLPEFATILAFDVSVDKAASEMAEELKVKIFTADIIYHLFDQFSAYMEGITNERKAKAEELAVFPCICKIMPQFIFNKKDPVVVGVEVLEGVLKVGTPLVVPATGMTDIGRVIGIENNRKEVQSAKKGASVSVKISNEANPSQQFGRQFDAAHPLYSKITRSSINALKEFFKTDVTKEEWQLIIKMKKVMNID